MAKIEEYVSGEAGKGVRNAYDLMQSMETLEDGHPLVEAFKDNLNGLAPLKLDLDQAGQYIKNAYSCALGERMCRCEFPESPHTYSVFLDELGDALVEAGKARRVSKEEAIKALGENVGNPIVMSKSEGKYMEICRTNPDHCFYWNVEKRGLKCLKRPKG